ncbi:E3 UFM1-protein ligase 1 homolog isoform X1 [Chelonus insularis]|uniref:E3 UFM1-protein ligase 1 homolog isoform X1 n=1 Tax=Chelonus insularis TaxID=460826 RepID=UPI00158C9E87|nr:E3 UFM1-protein ligase 1 homolog isoform X1 [Chelonus insularis]
MSLHDWEEVKRLAADFQKVQLTTSSQRLSERNCVEIITKLIEANLLNVIFTIDGKEYVTPQHLEKEIKDELYIHGGRINLVELTKILNVDFTQISKVATEIEKNDKGIKRILGQLIDKTYMMKIVQEINDKLNQVGFMNIADLTLDYDLPGEFLQSLIEKSLGKTIYGRQDQQDPKFFYTEGFIARNRAIIRGALSAITKPTPLSAILGQCNIPERIFFSIIDSLSGSMQFPGVISGRHSTSGIYVPTIYSKCQSEWVDNFYKQNGYIEYDALIRLGISEPKNYIKRHFSQNTFVLLRTVAVGTAIIDQIDANIEEVIATNSFVDIYPLMPSVFTPEDIETLLKEALNRSKTQFYIFATTVIVSDVFLQKLNKSLESLAEKKAKEVVENGKWLQYIIESKLKNSAAKNIENKRTDSKKDERRKKAVGGKAGGGTQGRETKMKAVKKKYNQGKNHEMDSDDEKSVKMEKSELILVSFEDLKNQLEIYENLTDIPELCDELINYFHQRLNKLAYQIAEKFSQTNKTTNLSEIEEKLNLLINNIKIFEKGIKCLSNKESILLLSKYLMKTLGTDFINEILKLAAQQNVIQCLNNTNNEMRLKTLQDLPVDVREPLNNVHVAITKGSVEEFLNSIDEAMASCCLVLKKFDKKKEKSLILSHRQALLEQLSEIKDPPLALHLVTSILFTAATQTALHISGRHVSIILTFLQDYIKPDTFTKLMQYHDQVLKLLSSEDEFTKNETLKLLEDGLQQLKDIAFNFKDHINAVSDKNHE